MEDFCNEETDSCDSSPNDDLCQVEDSCNIGTCDVENGDSETGCRYDQVCKDICRGSGYYAKLAGYEREGGNIVQDLLDAVGGVEVCGQSIDETSNDSSPYLEGLGLDSALEGLCVYSARVQPRALYRQLVTTALNCAMSGGAHNCDAVVDPFMELTFSECSDLCYYGSYSDSDRQLIDSCTHQLECYNSGGRIINGNCALGHCNVTDALCGADYGVCPPVVLVTLPILQTCERFPNNCRDEAFCQEGLGVCPSSPSMTSHRACGEARRNSCTIDDCFE
jgi:hypothetical protein